MAVFFAAMDGATLLAQPDYTPPWEGYLFLASAWLANRRGLYAMAAALTLTMFPVVLFRPVLQGESSNPAASFSYLLLGLIVASILLPLRGLLLFAAANLLALLAMPVLAPTVVPSLARIQGSFVLLAIGTGLLAVSMRHRDALERERQAQVRDSEERLRLALEAARMLTWDWDVGSGRIRWSGLDDALPGDPAASDAAPREVSYAAYLGWVHPEDRAEVEEAVRSALASAAGRLTLRHRVHGAGDDRWVEAHGRLDRDPAGRPVRLRGTAFDVSVQRRAEREREALLAELAAKNAELERFTYTASHDLKSPLVTVRGFLSFVEKDALEGNHERLRGDLRRIREATEKMGRLLDELLELSRIGRQVNPPQPIPFAELARDAVSLVAGRIEQRGVEVVIGDDLPVVHGDRVRLLQVLQNLLDNAVKFLGDQVSPRVEIGARPGPRTVLYVRDNGVGIEARHRERVFGLFDKLDPDSEGTGVGLALVKRIVELHGGRVWVESDGPGTGTTFCFTLEPGARPTP